MNDLHALIDPRIWNGDLDLSAWKRHLRLRLYTIHRGRSTLTLQPLVRGFEVHESIFPRRYVPKSVSWQWRIFSGVNSMVLLPGEHRPDPPDRVLGYWLAVVYYGKDKTDQWIDDLPFKVRPDKPWLYTDLIETLYRIPSEFQVHRDWFVWFDSIKERYNNGDRELLGFSGV